MRTNTGPINTQNKWESTIKPVAKFGTVSIPPFLNFESLQAEDFWQIYQFLKRPD